MPPENLGRVIDNYYASRGSPMAGTGAALVQAGRRWGVDPRLLVGISIIESSGGKATRLPHNAWNWGVHRGQKFGSYADAANAVARGLRQNYLDAGLTTPAQIVSKYAPASDNNDEGNWASVVGGVVQQLGGPRSLAAQAPAQRGAPPAPPPVASGRPVFDRKMFGRSLLANIVAGGGRTDLGSLPSLIGSSYAVPPPSAPPAPGRPSVPSAPGVVGGAAPSVVPNYSSLKLGKKIGTPGAGTHTLGNWQSDNAYDIAIPEGTPIRADFDGVVGSNIGPLGQSGSRFAGSRVQIDGKGNSAWYGHLSSYLVKPGQRVKKGQIIGYSGSANGVPHLHVGYKHL